MKPEGGSSASRPLLPDQKALWPVAGLCLLAVVAYANSLDAPFVFDDLLTIQRNTAVRFGEFHGDLFSGRALLFVTFALNSLWSGQAVWSYHLVNLLLHLANGLVLFFVGDSVFRRTPLAVDAIRRFAFLAAALFLVHPVQTESVTYISSRSELLSLFFFLLGFMIFARWPAERIGWVTGFAVTIPFLLALSSKETAISLPVTCLLYDYLFLSRGSFHGMLLRWRFHALFLFAGLGVGLYLAFVTLRGSIGPGVAGALSSWSYFLTQLRVVTQYSRLVFVPLGLNLDHDVRPSTSAWELPVLLSVLYLSGILALGWLLRRRQPLASFSIFWFFITLAPTSSVIPVLDVMFEHRLYLPLAGVCLSFPLLVDAASRRFRPWLGDLLSPNACAALLLGTFTAGTFVRNNTWRDEVRLYEDITAKSPEKTRGYSGLSWALFKRGQYEPALQVLQRGLARRPDRRSDFEDALGNLYLKTGRYAEAVDLFQETLRSITDPAKRSLTYNNLGVTHLYLWEQAKAKQRAAADPLSESDMKREAVRILRPAQEAFLKAVENDPQYLAAYDSYINVTFEMGEGDALETRASAELSGSPSYQSAYALAKLAFLRQDWARADELFVKAVARAPAEKVLRFNHAYTLEKLGKIERATAEYLEALRIDPLFVEAHYNVAVMYLRSGRNAEAIDHLQEVLRYNPVHRNANLSLARLAAQAGDRNAAGRFLRTLLRTLPGDPEVVALARQLGF